MKLVELVKKETPSNRGALKPPFAGGIQTHVFHFPGERHNHQKMVCSRVGTYLIPIVEANMQKEDCFVNYLRMLQYSIHVFKSRML